VTGQRHVLAARKGGGAEFEFRLLVEGGKERGADARPLSALSERLTVIANLPLSRRSSHQGVD
jgi:hypothetical protein